MEGKTKLSIQPLVQWYEGQLLYPQHYQQFQNNLHQSALFYLNTSSPWHWGIYDFEIDETLFLKGVISMRSLLAIFPDGSIFDLSTMPQKIEFDFSKKKSTLEGQALKLHLAVLRKEADAAEVSSKKHARYTSVESQPISDENTGDGAITMPRLHLNVSLLSEKELDQRYCAFPFMEIRFDHDGFTRTDFTPPLLRVSKENSLGASLEKIITDIRKRIGFLSERLQNVLSQETASLLEYYSHVYSVLTSRIITLEALYFTGKSHPFDVYKELCTLCGIYSTLQRGQMPPVFEAYNHNDLHETFSPVLNFIGRMLDVLRTPSVVVPFSRNGRIFERKVRKAWLENGFLTLGLHLAPEINSASTIISWLNSAIIGSSSVIESLKERRILGAKREVVEQAPELGLLSSERQVLVKVMVDPHFITEDEDLQILNPSDSNETRPQEVVLYTAG